jgi:hypothetical protein
MSSDGSCLRAEWYPEYRCLILGEAIKKRWFTIVPLPGSHLTRYLRPFPSLRTTAAFGRSSGRWFGAFSCNTSPRDLPSRLHSYARRVVCLRFVLLVAHLENDLRAELQLPRQQHQA